MDTETLKRLRLEMCYDKVNMAVIMELPYATYKAYESGARCIPLHIARRARKKHALNKTQMKNLIASIGERIDAAYPDGIPSEVRE